MTDTVLTGSVSVKYDILTTEIDGQPAYWWVAGNGNFEEDEYYVSLEDAQSAVESYFQ